MMLKKQDQKTLSEILIASKLIEGGVQNRIALLYDIDPDLIHHQIALNTSSDYVFVSSLINHITLNDNFESLFNLFDLLIDQFHSENAYVRNAIIRMKRVISEQQEELKASTLNKLSGESSSDSYEMTKDTAISKTTNSESSKADIQFSLYNPSEIIEKERAYLYAYAHTFTTKQDVEQDILRFQSDLGEILPKVRQAKSSVALEKGTEITIIPECDDVTFDPPQLTKTWHGDWTRYIFEFRPENELTGQMIYIRLSIRVKGIEIAHIKTACDVIGADSITSHAVNSITEPIPSEDTNPLVHAAQRGDLRSQTALLYQKMFISYSRQDKEIALKRAKEIENIVGAEVFIDINKLRAGDDWQYQLAKAIDESDVFHLLWSEHSATSKYCRYEWEYAIKHKCPENQCIGVIRPIYWNKSLPKPPPELEHLHFEYVDLT